VPLPTVCEIVWPPSTAHPKGGGRFHPSGVLAVSKGCGRCGCIYLILRGGRRGPPFTGCLGISARLSGRNPRCAFGTQVKARDAANGYWCHLRDLVIPVPPWREESTPQTFGNVLSSDWIPAFAEMTGGSSGSPFQMTPALANCPMISRCLGVLVVKRRIPAIEPLVQ